MKLVTKEDPFHIHKVSGILCLTNFAYQTFRYLSGLPVRLTSPPSSFLLIPHVALHLTSFVFRVLPRRHSESKSAMYIWEELRIHAMIFAFRGCLVIWFPDYGFPVSIGSMVLADITSHVYGSRNISTVRGEHSRHGSRSLIKECTAAFFSISQIGATVITSGLFQPTRSTFPGEYSMLVFATLPPIQTSAFGMTLIRKNIINKQVWSVVYCTELLFVYYVWYRTYQNMNALFVSIGIYLLRRIGIPKYAIWAACYYYCYCYCLLLPATATFPMHRVQ